MGENDDEDDDDNDDDDEKEMRGGGVMEEICLDVSRCDLVRLSLLALWLINMRTCGGETLRPRVTLSCRHTREDVG